MPVRKKPSVATVRAVKRASKSAGKSQPRSPRVAHYLTSAALLSEAKDPKLSLKRRLGALMRLEVSACTNEGSFDQVLSLALDTAVPSELRGTALDLLQSATFLPSAFAPRRADYIEGLRELRSDADIAIRRRALGTLARMKDGDTQAVLIGGLDDSSQSLLAPEEALQLLSYDAHAGAFDAARRIAKDPPSDAARSAALRVLAADSASTGMFERMVYNKTEPAALRQQAAVALNNLAPDRLRRAARDLALDESEVDAMRSVGLTALSVLSDAATLTADKALESSVASIADKSKSTLLGAATSNYSRRRTREI